jgi:hypothetical protein
LQNATGNARFGGNVSIGSNLSVAGLITAGNLVSNTVITTTVQPAAITTAASYNTLTVVQRLSPGIAGTFVYDTTTLSVTTQQANQPVYLFGTLQNEARTTQIFTPDRVWSLTYDVALFRKVGSTFTIVGDYQRYVYTNQAASSEAPVVVTPFVGYLDIPATIGTYEYVYGMRFASIANVAVVTFEFETRNILAQLLKR